MISNRFQKQSGFTLLELMITISLVFIVAGIAAPSFQSSIENSRLNSNYNELRGALNYARAEAVRRGNPVHISSRLPGNWTSGLVVFIDEGGAINGNNEWDPNENALKFWDVMHEDMTLRMENNNAFIIFNAEGLANESDTFHLCDRRAGANETAREVQLLISGLTAGRKSSDCR